MSKFKFRDKVLNSDGVLGVVTNEIDGECFVAWACHELDQGWYREDELTPATDWVKCSERMPEHDGFYLTIMQDVATNAQWQEIVCLAYGKWSDSWQSTITHWMPLPAPPQD